MTKIYELKVRLNSKENQIFLFNIFIIKQNIKQILIVFYFCVKQTDITIHIIITQIINIYFYSKSMANEFHEQNEQSF